MAIDVEKVRWASVTETDPVTGYPNKLTPSSEFKNTGLKNNQPLPLQWLNNQFNEVYNALQEAQAQIDAIVGGSSQPTLELIFGIGAYYMSNEATAPATIFGFGTWVAVEGEFIVGVDTGDTDWDVGGKTGGSKTHTHTDNLSVDDHALTIDEMPAHSHTYSHVDTFTNAGSGSSYNSQSTSDQTSVVGNNLGHDHPLSGGVQTANGVPPFRAAYIWYRSA